jgi:hypothetical protein
MKKKITVEEYNKKMDKIIGKKKPVHLTLIEMLNEASKYELQTSKKTTKKTQDSSKGV